MGFADWLRGTKDVQHGKGAPTPNSHASSQARESYEAGRREQERRQEQIRREQQKKK